MRTAAIRGVNESSIRPTEHPGLNPLLHCNTEHLPFALLRVEQQAIAGMGNGMIDAMVVQNPYEMGYQGVRLLKALAQGDEMTKKEMLPNLGKPNGDLFDTGIKVVVPDKDTALKAGMFDNKEKNIKTYKLSQFREWLKKYNLTAS